MNRFRFAAIGAISLVAMPGWSQSLENGTYFGYEYQVTIQLGRPISCLGYECAKYKRYEQVAPGVLRSMFDGQGNADYFCKGSPPNNRTYACTRQGWRQR